MEGITHPEKFRANFRQKTDDDRIEIESRQRDGDTKSKFKFEFDTSDGEVEIAAKFYSSQDASKEEYQSLWTNPRQQRSRIRAELEQIIIYSNADSSAEYKAGTSTVIKTIDFDAGEVAWAPIETKQSDVEGKTVFTASVASVDGKWGVVVYITSDPLEVGDFTVSPQKVKIDVWLNDTTKPADAHYAVVIKAKSAQSVEAADDSTNSVALGGNSVFQWTTECYAGDSTTATTDCISGPTQETAPKEDDESTERLYFSVVPTDNKIIWDPELGFGAASSAMIALPSLILLAVAIFASL